MPTLALEGTGSRISFQHSNVSAGLITLSLPERSRDTIDTTHLGSTAHKTSKAAKLLDPGQVTAEFDHNPGSVVLLKEEQEWISIYYPRQPGEQWPARIRFLGFVVNEGGEEFTVGARLTTKVTMQINSDLFFHPATNSQ